jgi:hypothetical protein
VSPDSFLVEQAMTEDLAKKEDSEPLPPSPQIEMAGVDADDHETGYLSHLYYGLRSIYIPTSPYKVLKAQKALLSSFVRSIRHITSNSTPSPLTPFPELRSNTNAFSFSQGNILITSTSSIRIMNKMFIQLPLSWHMAMLLVLLCSSVCPLSLCLSVDLTLSLSLSLARTLSLSSCLYCSTANYDDLSTKFARVISFDWLGMGGSSRPSTGPIYDEKKPDACVDFFLDSTMVPSPPSPAPPPHLISFHVFRNSSLGSM